MTQEEQLKQLVADYTQNLVDNWEAELEDALQITVIKRETLDGQAQDVDFEVLMTTGGPHVYYTTDGSELHASWGGKKTVCEIDWEIRDQIWEYLDEMRMK